MFEIPQRPSRNHSFSKAEKWRLLVEYDKCLDRGAKAAFHRTVGVHSSTMRDWVAARDDGQILPPGAVSNSTKQEVTGWMNSRDRDELNRLRKENEKLRAKLEKSEATVDILGKASALLEALARSATATDPHLEAPTRGRPEWLQKSTPESPEDTSAE